MALDADTKVATESAAPRQPLYAHIASKLQQRIVEGHYPISSLLPAETI